MAAPIFEWFRYSFGEEGTLSPIPEVIQGGGEVSFQEGWSSDYELNPDTEVNSKDIDRAQHNQLWKTITGNVKFWQQHLYPLFTPAADNGAVAVSYSFGTRVRHNPGGGENIYEVIDVAGTTALPTVAADWVVVSSAYPRSGTAGNQQRTNAQNETLYQGVGEHRASSDPGITARGFIRLNDETITNDVIRTGVNADLFALLGTSNGEGNGTSTFGLPRVAPTTRGFFSKIGTFAVIGAYIGTAPLSIGVNPTTNDVWVGDGSGDIYRLAGGVGAWTLIGAYPGTTPTGIFIDDGDVYIADIDSGEVYKLTNGTGTYNVIGGAFPATNPRCVTVNGITKDVFVGSDGTSVNDIYKLPGGVGSWEVLGSYPGDGPVGLAVHDITENLYISDAVSPDNVHLLRGGSGDYETFDTYPGSGLKDITIDQNTGNIFVVDSSSDIIHLVLFDSTEFIPMGTFPGTANGISFNSSNLSIWFADGVGDDILKLTGNIIAPPVYTYIKT